MKITEEDCPFEKYSEEYEEWMGIYERILRRNIPDWTEVE